MPLSLRDELYSTAAAYLDIHMPLSSQTHYQPLARGQPRASQATPCSTSSIPSCVVIKNPSTQYPTSFQKSIDDALKNAWAPATLKTYATGINAYVTFCRLHHIPSNLAYPSSEFLLCAFFASKQDLAPATLKNYTAGLRAWHIRENHVFPTSERLKLIIKASSPRQAAPPPKQPVTIEMLECLASNLTSSPFDTAVLACACTAFWALCRLGELLPNSATTFDASRYPLVSHISLLPSNEFKLFLPWTKVKRQAGEPVYLSQQHGPSNPISVMHRHLLSTQTPGSLLFSYTIHTTSHILSKHEFISRCNAIWLAHNMPQATGHSFRIGGTTHLLLCGINPNTIKKAGRWASDSYLRYWRSLEIILPTAVRFATPAPRPPTVPGEPRESLGHGRAVSFGRANDTRGAPTATGHK